MRFRSLPLAVVAAFALALSLTGCGPEAQPAQNAQPSGVQPNVGKGKDGKPGMPAPPPIEPVK